MSKKEAILVTIMYVIPIIGFVSFDLIYLKFLAAAVCAIPGIVYILRRRDLFSISYIGDWKKSILFEMIWLVPVLVLLYFFGDEIRDIMYFQLGDQVSLRSAVSPIIFIIAYGLFSSPLQELIFRGVMFFHSHKFLQNQSLAVLTTASVFAISHIWYPSIYLVLITFVLGIIWGYSRARYNSLVGPSIGHAIIGTIGFLFNFI